MNQVAIHAAELVLPIVAPPIVDGAVAVSGDRIVAVGSRDQVCRQFPSAELAEWAGVLMPGLVNAHTHLQYTAYADLADSGLAFPDWLAQFALRRRQMTEDDWRESTADGVRQLLRSGTTAAADIVTNEAALGPVSAPGQELAGVSYIELISSIPMWHERADWLHDVLDRAPKGRTLGISPHTPYTVDLPVMRDLVRLGRAGGLRIHPHVAETLDEVEYVASGTGPLAVANAGFGWQMALMDGGCGLSPVGYLDGLGVLGPDCHVAHGVHVDDADRAVLRERGVAVALCVRSNEILGAGEPPVADYLAEGNLLAIGTDSLASSPSLDLLEEAVAVRDLALAQGADPEGLERRIIAAATIGGATSMGLTDVGRLKPGARADMAIFNVDPDPSEAYAALLDHGPCLATVLGGVVMDWRENDREEVR